MGVSADCWGARLNIHIQPIYLRGVRCQRIDHTLDPRISVGTFTNRVMTAKKLLRWHRLESGKLEDFCSNFQRR